MATAKVARPGIAFAACSPAADPVALLGSVRQPPPPPPRFSRLPNVQALDLVLQSLPHLPLLPMDLCRLLFSAIESHAAAGLTYTLSCSGGQPGPTPAQIAVRFEDLQDRNNFSTYAHACCWDANHEPWIQCDFNAPLEARGDFDDSNVRVSSVTVAGAFERHTHGRRTDQPTSFHGFPGPALLWDSVLQRQDPNSGKWIDVVGIDVFDPRLPAWEPVALTLQIPLHHQDQGSRKWRLKGLYAVMTSCLIFE